MIDPSTLKRQVQNSFWVFDIMLTDLHLPSVECVGYRIEKAPGFVGRRTHIFVNNVYPTLLNGVAITVIKDQYCYEGHRFSEVAGFAMFTLRKKFPELFTWPIQKCDKG